MREVTYDPTQPLAPPEAPLPLVTPETEDFWRGGLDNALMILRCQGCGLYIHPPQPVCPNCLSFTLETEEVSGRATLTSYTINFQQWTLTMQVPFVIGVVDLVEQTGLRLTTNIIETPVERIRIGMALEVVFLKRSDVWLPMFRGVD
jgi:uncharacterized OB-fold protein